MNELKGSKENFCNSHFMNKFALLFYFVFPVRMKCSFTHVVSVKCFVCTPHLRLFQLISLIESATKKSFLPFTFFQPFFQFSNKKLAITFLANKTIFKSPLTVFSLSLSLVTLNYKNSKKIAKISKKNGFYAAREKMRLVQQIRIYSTLW